MSYEAVQKINDGHAELNESIIKVPLRMTFGKFPNCSAN